MIRGCDLDSTAIQFNSSSQGTNTTVVTLIKKEIRRSGLAIVGPGLTSKLGRGLCFTSRQQRVSDMPSKDVDMLIVC